MASGSDAGVGNGPAVSETPTVRAWFSRRARIVGGALAVGLVVGGLATVGMAGWTGDARRAESTVFALGALALGFGVLGWSGSIFAGRGIENMQRHMGTHSDWSERDSRRAMARIGGFGSGVMVGTSVVVALL